MVSSIACLKACVVQAPRAMLQRCRPGKFLAERTLTTYQTTPGAFPSTGPTVPNDKLQDHRPHRCGPLLASRRTTPALTGAAQVFPAKITPTAASRDTILRERQVVWQRQAPRQQVHFQEHLVENSARLEVKQASTHTPHEGGRDSRFLHERNTSEPIWIGQCRPAWL